MKNSRLGKKDSRPEEKIFDSKKKISTRKKKSRLDEKILDHFYPLWLAIQFDAPHKQFSDPKYQFHGTWSMNDLPVIRYLCYRKEFWDRQGANIASH